MRAAQRQGEEDLMKHAQEVQAVRTEHEKDKANMAHEVSARHQTLVSKAIRLSVLMCSSSASVHMRCGCALHAWRCLYMMWYWLQICHRCDACKDQQWVLQDVLNSVIEAGVVLNRSRTAGHVKDITVQLHVCREDY